MSEGTNSSLMQIIALVVYFMTLKPKFEVWSVATGRPSCCWSSTTGTASIIRPWTHRGEAHAHSFYRAAWHNEPLKRDFASQILPVAFTEFAFDFNRSRAGKHQVTVIAHGNPTPDHQDFKFETGVFRLV